MTDQDHAKIVREARVTQADLGDKLLAAFIQDDDTLTLEQAATAIAHYRLAAEAAAFEKAAGVAERQYAGTPGWSGHYQNAGTCIASAIRALAGDKHD